MPACIAMQAGLSCNQPNSAERQPHSEKPQTWHFTQPSANSS